MIEGDEAYHKLHSYHGCGFGNIHTGEYPLAEQFHMSKDTYISYIPLHTYARANKILLNQADRLMLLEMDQITSLER